MRRDAGRILMWAMGCALLVPLALLTHELSIGGTGAVQIALPLVVAIPVVGLLHSVLAAGVRAPPDLLECYHIHRAGLGAKAFFFVGGIGLALLMFWLAWDKDSVGLWIFATIWSSGCLYATIAVFIYQIVWDDDVIWARDRLFRWHCHPWADLNEIERSHDAYSWKLRFASKSRIELSIFTNSLQIILDHAQEILSTNQRRKVDDA